MKTERWITGIGSFVLCVAGISHGTGYFGLASAIEKTGMRPPLDGIAKASWLNFSVELVAVAVIAFVASKKEHGGAIVLLCAACMGVTGFVLLRFLGPSFVGVYVTWAITVLFLLGGWMQVKQRA
jgi:hypothetical protein